MKIFFHKLYRNRMKRELRLIGPQADTAISIRKLLEAEMRAAALLSQKAAHP